jgi:hypothetical protein
MNTLFHNFTAGNSQPSTQAAAAVRLALGPATGSDEPSETRPAKFTFMARASR